MKLLPTDINTFSKMIKEGYLYIDKTEQIARLFEGGARYFFLSRPRRFGKSLLISTLKSAHPRRRRWLDGRGSLKDCC